MITLEVDFSDTIDNIKAKVEDLFENTPNSGD